MEECECNCAICVKMCHAPCCGLVIEIEELIKRGFGDRLMLDDYETDEIDDFPFIFIKPALKGYESRRGPYSLASIEGCTFWKNNKCELHDKNLKPFQGRIASHKLPFSDIQKIEKMLAIDWKTKEAKNLIKKFKLNFLKE